MAITLASRYKSVQPFVRFHSREDDRYGAMQLGFTTYHETESDGEEYRTSYLEWGGRSDHLSVPLAKALGQDLPALTTDSVSTEDADYVRPLDAPKVVDLKVAV